MGIHSNTVSVYQYRVIGTDKGPSWVAERLGNKRFVPIDDLADDERVGWVTIDDTNGGDFTNINVFSREPYYAFTLRRDKRSVPPAALKALVDRECAKWLEQRPALSKVPLRRRMEIKDAVRAALLSKAIPVPSTWDVVWNRDTSILTVCAVTEKALDLVEDVFQKTFDEVSLEPLHPMARARLVLDDKGRELLDRHNKAPSKDVLLEIKRNRWLGWDFLLWLAYKTDRADTACVVRTHGPVEQDEGFAAWVQDRFVLASEGEKGRSITSIRGPQREFAEVRQAIANGKNLTEAVICMEKGEMTWKITLRADIFAFCSFSCPVVHLVHDETADPMHERIAWFYERMGLFETGMQLFDSLLLAFLVERTGSGWDEQRRRIDRWVSGH